MCVNEQKPSSTTITENLTYYLFVARFNAYNAFLLSFSKIPKQRTLFRPIIGQTSTKKQRGEEAAGAGGGAEQRTKQVPNRPVNFFNAPKLNYMRS